MLNLMYGLEVGRGGPDNDHEVRHVPLDPLPPLLLLRAAQLVDLVREVGDAGEGGRAVLVELGRREYGVSRVRPESLIDVMRRMVISHRWRFSQMALRTANFSMTKGLTQILSSLLVASIIILHVDRC